jgi:hypothetical protein
LFGEELDEPVGGVGWFAVVWGLSDVPGVGASVWVEGWVGEDLASFASDVESFAEACACVVSDFGGAVVVEVASSCAGGGFDGFGELSIGLFEVVECVGAFVFESVVYVEDEDVAVCGSSGGDADAVAVIGVCPPFGDGVGVGGGFVLPFVDWRVFHAWFDGDDSDAELGVAEGGLEHSVGHAVSS